MVSMTPALLHILTIPFPIGYVLKCVGLFAVALYLSTSSPHNPQPSAHSPCRIPVLHLLLLLSLPCHSPTRHQVRRRSLAHSAISQNAGPEGCRDLRSRQHRRHMLSATGKLPRAVKPATRYCVCVQWPYVQQLLRGRVRPSQEQQQQPCGCPPGRLQLHKHQQ
jgi:hypothetical protein